MAHAQVSQRKVIVLPFEGVRGEQVRTAAEAAIKAEYTLVTEDQAVTAGDRLRVDVGTPEGLNDALKSLRVELLVTGNIEGSGRDAITRVSVQNLAGEELATREIQGPASARDVATVAGEILDAVRNASLTLTERNPQAATQAYEDEPMPSGGNTEVEHPETPSTPSAWSQPFLLPEIAFRLRTRWAVIAPRAQDKFVADLYPDWALDLTMHPFNKAADLSAGLWFNAHGAFSLGLGYQSNNGKNENFQTYQFGIKAGYDINVDDKVRFGPELGFGIDGYGVARPVGVDFPSATYTQLRLGLNARFRVESAFEPHASFAYLWVLDAGDISKLGTNGKDIGGIQLGVGATGKLTETPGGYLTYNVGFSYQYYYLTFKGGPGGSGKDDGIMLSLGLGYWIDG